MTQGSLQISILKESFLHDEVADKDFSCVSDTCHSDMEHSPQPALCDTPWIKDLDPGDDF